MEDEFNEISIISSPIDESLDVLEEDSNAIGAETIDIDSSFNLTSLYSPSIALPFFETSAKEGARIQEAFRYIAEQVISQKPEGESAIETLPSSFQLDQTFHEREQTSSSTCFC